MGGPSVTDIRATVPSVMLRSGLRQDRQLAQVADGVPQLTRIAHADRKALQTLDGFAHAFAANRGAHDALHVRNCHAIAADGIAIDIDFDVAATRESFGQR